MLRLTRLPLILALAGLALPAWAKDKKKDAEEEDVEAAPAPKVDEDAFDENEEDDEPKKERPKEDDSKDEEPEPDELDLDESQDDEPEIDFKNEDEQQTVAPRGPGEDTAQLYREQQKKCQDMTPDEEQIAWENYLRKYPNSLFRERIETRMEELSSLMFGERVPGSDQGARKVDAAKRELNFATPVKFASADPRTHLSAGFEWGFPTWFGGRLGFEYQFARPLSAHVDVFRDFTGGAIALGGKYALVKSARTGTLVSGMFDLKVNMAPFFPTARPALAAGQRLDVLRGLDLQLQLGADIEFRDSSDIRWFGGFHGELRASDIVYVFAETTVDVKYLGSKEIAAPFQFMVATFGLKFVPRAATDDQGGGRITTGLLATAPYTSKYWGFYQGGLGVVGDMYL